MKKLIFIFLLLSGVSIAGYMVLTDSYQPIVKTIVKTKKNRTLKISAENPDDSILIAPSTYATPSDSVILTHLLGKFDYTKDTFFVYVAPEHCSKPMYLQKETYRKFKEMHAAAKKDGINLKIISGTRNFNEQKAIWERKWNVNIKTMDSIKAAKTILLYSSMPTTSRHHWGTDMDINSLENSYFESGQGLKEYNWLKKNASKYGFCQVYSDKKTTNRKGYEMEKWHWSYIPISRLYLQKYNAWIDYSLIKGFIASELAPKLKAREDFVNGIDTSCH